MPIAKKYGSYSPEKAAFPIRVNGESLNYRVNSIFVLPQENIAIDLGTADSKAEYIIKSPFGPQQKLRTSRWSGNTPSIPGTYPVEITNSRSASAVIVNVFVLVPLDRVEDGYLNGYRIGNYPKTPLRNLPTYTLPRGFVEVTPENETLRVSPHFRLQQFLCKQDGGYPKYLILNARLLSTLEVLLELANKQGYYCQTFTIMSGYRTPHYNRAIGNRTTYSRHLWGDAADIFIDENPQDGKMDDLNQDGVIDYRDAEVMYDLIENAYIPRYQRTFLGGLARYRETSWRGPFIHVDVRGSHARWGVANRSREGATSPIAFHPDSSSARSTLLPMP
ncbi:MAG: D-Ala-D-Ala carboxypeptidase family metallohydrolase [Candidatus Binatia bacterium]